MPLCCWFHCLPPPAEPCHVATACPMALQAKGKRPVSGRSGATGDGEAGEGVAAAAAAGVRVDVKDLDSLIYTR